MASIIESTDQNIQLPSGWAYATVGLIVLQVCVMFSILIFTLWNGEMPVTIVLGLLIYMASTAIFIWWAKKRVVTLYELQIFYFIIYYLFGIYTLKIVYGLFSPHYFWPAAYGPVLSLKPNLSTLAHAYFIFISGYIVFFLGYLMLGKRPNIRMNSGSANKFSEEANPKNKDKISTIVIAIACTLGLILKIVSLYLFKIGQPSIVPPMLLIPGLAGIIYFLFTPGLLFMLTLLLLITAIKRHFFLFGFALVLFGGFAIIDLSVGWKTPFLSHPLILIMVAYVFNRRHLKTLAKLLVIGSLVLSFIGVGAYIGIQHYRYARIAKRADSTQLGKAIFSTSASLVKGITSIYARLGGLDQLIMTMNYIERHPEFRPLGITSIFGTEVTEFFTHKIAGIPIEAVASAGSNQWGLFLLSVGFYGLMGGMFLLGIALNLTQKLFLYKIKNPLLGYAIVPSICLLFVKVFASAGDFIYLAKFVLILWLCYFFASMILASESTQN